MGYVETTAQLDLPMQASRYFGIRTNIAMLEC
jgi:hypothetical protein